MKRSRIFLALALCAGFVFARESYDKARKAYNTWVKRPSLAKRTRGRERLAQTGDLRALQVLFQSYARPEAPKEFVRYLIAGIATEYLDEDEEMSFAPGVRLHLFARPSTHRAAGSGPE